MTRVAVVEHQADCTAAAFADWLAEVGVEVVVHRPYAGDALPAAGAYDGLLVLGGSMGAHDDAAHPWLGPLKEQVRATDAPVLGLCLGHQLLAAAYGGEVRRSPYGQTVGPVAIGWTADATDDPLTAGLEPAAIGFFWNDDTVAREPDGVVPLARNAHGELQAARFGPRAWGVQWHPEIDAAISRTWAVEDALGGALSPDVEDALARTAAREEEHVRAWRPLAHRFAGICAGNPAGNRAGNRAGTRAETRGGPS